MNSSTFVLFSSKVGLDIFSCGKKKEKVMETVKLNWKKDKQSNNLNISFRDCSITDVDADAVITVFTSSGDKPGGLSESIIKRAGNSVLDEIHRSENPKKVSENFVTKAGSLKCKYIIHCVCPKWANYDEGSKSECLKDLCNTVKRALFTACEKKLGSVALPPIGSGKLSTQWRQSLQV